MPPPPAADVPDPVGTEGGDDHDVDDEEFDDSATVNLSTVLRRRAEEQAKAGPPPLQAVFCPAAHPNPAHAETCRQCGAPIVDRSIRSIARPVLGRLRFDDGAVVELRQPVLIGRNPPSDAVLGSELAIPVRLPDREALISRSHVAVHLDGWHVKLVDQDSKNFTYITIPGQPKQRLVAGTPTTVPIGTVVVLGEAASFTFEPPA